MVSKVNLEKTLREHVGLRKSINAVIDLQEYGFGTRLDILREVEMSKSEPSDSLSRVYFRSSVVN